MKKRNICSKINTGLKETTLYSVCMAVISYAQKIKCVRCDAASLIHVPHISRVATLRHTTFQAFA